MEILVTVLIAVATVATAWSTYQAARWGGKQTINFSGANADRVEATILADQAGQETQIDVTTFIAWANAYAVHNQDLADFYFHRFRTEFTPAVDAWVATDPLTNPDAPPTPFAMPEYHHASADRADALLRQADAHTAEAKRDSQRSDNYVLTVVLFASSLFFAGISTKLDMSRMRITILTLGYVLFIGALAWVATFPVTVSV